MGGVERPKVCFTLCGVPVIARSIATYTRCGIENHIVVVGRHAEQVARAVGERFPRAIFAFQPEPLGTGHAARCGAAVLDAFAYAGDVMVVAGDKVLKEHAVRQQIELFRRTGADLCLMVGRKGDFPSSGRIVEDDSGNVLGNVEVGDIARARLVGQWFHAARSGPLPSERIRGEMLRAFPTGTKARRAFPSLCDLLERRATVTLDDLRSCLSPQEAFFEFTTCDGRTVRLSAQEVEQRARYANLCVHIFRADALRYALGRLARRNAQGEEYLTDVLGILASARNEDGRSRFRIALYCIKERTDALAFNTLEELREIRRHYGDPTEQ